MCPILSRCLSQVDSDSDLVHLGCSSSRCWAEINDKVRSLEMLEKMNEFEWVRIGIERLKREYE